MTTLTGANATFLLSVLNLFPVPVQLQGFATDDSFASQPLKSGEVLMGVDGNLSGGFVFVPFEMEVALQADSQSALIFDQWFAAEQAVLDKYVANAVIIQPAIGTKWALTRGFLTSYHAVPDTKRLIQPRKFGITWNLVSPASV